MLRRSSGRAVALAALALCAALLTPPAPVAASESDAGTLTTQLQPGRSMAAWFSPELRAQQRVSETGQTAFEFPDDLPAERQAEIRDSLAGVLAFFAEYYGMETPQFSVIVDPDLGDRANANRERIALSTSAAREGDLRGVLAHEYFHVLQFNLATGAEQHFASSPAWLNEGSAEYARGLYLREQGMSTGEQQRSRRWLQSTSYNGGLQTLAAGSFGSRGGAEYSLAALAVE